MNFVEQLQQLDFKDIGRWPFLFRALGIAIVLVVASGLLIWTFRTLGHNLTDTVVTRRDAPLVTHGPYRWVRHPFYLAFALAVIANTLVAASAFLAVTGGVAFLVMVVRTSIEEQKLIERFGPSYQEYMRRTGRFVPRICPEGAATR